MDAEETNRSNVSKTEEENQKNILLNNEKCDQCGMLFTSSDSLRIHKEKFCIGVTDSGVNRTNSPPINSKYIEDNKNNDNNYDLDDDFNDELDIMEKSLQNESLNDLDKEYQEIEPITSRTNKQTPRDQLTQREKNSLNNQTISKSKISISQPNDSENRFPDDNLTLKSKQASVYSNTRLMGTPSEQINFVTPKAQINAKTSKTSFNDNDTGKITNRTINDNNINNSLNNNNNSDNISLKSLGAAENAINEVKKFKNKKSVEQSLQDLEDTLVRDTIRDKKLVNSLNKTPPVSSNLDKKQDILNKSSEDDPYKQLLNEYSDLKKKEKEVLKEVYEYNPDFKSYSALHFKKDSDFFKHDFLSLFDNFDDIDLDLLDTLSLSSFGYKPKMNDETRINLRRIQEKTEQLERERRDIQYKIESLKNNTSYPVPVRSNPSVNRLLSELRDQQTLNEAALSLLRDRVVSEPISTSVPVRSSILPPLYSTNRPNSYYLSALTNNDLNNEDIRLMRLNYLQNGGHDQGILNKFTEMEYNARYPKSVSVRPTYSSAYNVDDSRENDLIKIRKPINAFNTDVYKNQTQSQPELSRDVDFEIENFPLVSELLARDVALDINPNTADLENRIQKIDIENKRIQAELELLQNKLAYSSPTNYDATKRYQNINLPPIQQSIPPPPPPQNNQYNALINGNQGFNGNPYANINTQNNRNFYTNQDQYNVQYSQSQRSSNNQTNRPPSNFRNDQIVQNQNLIRLKDLPPAVYDPNGGFVLFIDFVTNIEPNYASARVITCLHHPKSGLGEPSVLPIVNTETFNEKNYQNTVALISTKQPVPRCPPQQALTILIELQMGLKDNNETRLKSCAWTKIPLFDSKNRLLSGRWKCILKNLPIKSEAALNSFGSIPEYGNCELFYRLVNLRDSDDQTNAPISPAYADQYNPIDQEPIETESKQSNIKPNESNDQKAINQKSKNKVLLTSPNDHLLENHEKINETRVDNKSNKKEANKNPTPTKNSLPTLNKSNKISSNANTNNNQNTKKIVDISNKKTTNAAEIKLQNRKKIT